jgi:hypothetical protein
MPETQSFKDLKMGCSGSNKHKRRKEMKANRIYLGGLSEPNEAMDVVVPASA